MPRIQPASEVIELSAPAKLNLFLHVVGRRADGYHELQTVFQFIDLVDRVRIARRPDSILRRTIAVPGVAEADDLVIRAAQRLREASGLEVGADIGVEKRIPLGSGLGGGSSDAAATLVGLNYLWGLELDTDRLAALAVQLGADVPVFVRGFAAWAEGVGERLVPLVLERPWYVLIVPPVAVSTVDVFRNPALTRDTAKLTIPALLPSVIEQPGSPADIAHLLAAGRNDCEPVVREMEPQVGAALDWLARYGPARMSGTGAAVFVPFESPERAIAVAERVPAGWRGLVTRGLNRSPLFEDADRIVGRAAAESMD